MNTIADHLRIQTLIRQRRTRHTGFPMMQRRLSIESMRDIGSPPILPPDGSAHR